MSDLQKDGWVSIFKSNDSMDVNLKKSKLESLGIEAVIFDHQDTMLPTLNETKLRVSLLVHENDQERAENAISN